MSAPAPQSERSTQFYLPDFCRARAVLAIVVICELTAIVLALARNEAVLGFWSDLARTSMFLLWVGLAGAGTLCALRGYLNRRLSRERRPIVLQPMSFIPRSISARRSPSARSTPAWPAAASA